MKKIIRNSEEFKKLILRYESITLEEIEECWENIKYFNICFADVKRKLTGFGSTGSCVLCKGYYCVGEISCNCLYARNKDTVSCLKGKHKPTYDAIYYANDSEDLLLAYKNRAKHIREILKSWNINF